MRGEANSGGGSEACEEDGSVAGEVGKTAEACEGGGGEEEEEEVEGDAGVCIAACTSLASRCLAADVSVAP